MTWKLGHDGLESPSHTFSPIMPNGDASAIDVTIDSFEPDRPHVTVLFDKACVVSRVDELDETGDGQCSLTITSPNAELLIILPIRLATLLTSIEAAHREMLDEPTTPKVSTRGPDEVVRDVMQDLMDSVAAAREQRRLQVVRDDN